MANLVQWLRANKIALNSSKTELVLFGTPNTTFQKKNDRSSPKYLNFRLCGQKIFPSNSIKYLGVTIDKNLSFRTHVNEIRLKLSRATGMIAKIRHYVNFETLLCIYHAIFGCHLQYACQVWGQSSGQQLSKVVALQNKAMRLMHFQHKHFQTDILYYLSKVLKLNDLIKYANCLFVWKQKKTFFHLYLETILQIELNVAII